MSRRSRKAAHQIKRNITGWRGAGRDAAGIGVGRPGKLFFGGCAVFVAVLLPISLMALAAGIIFRIPDILSFEIGRGDVLAELALRTDAAAVAGELSDYLTHKKDHLALTTVVGHDDIAVFTFMDEANLGRVRALLDAALYPALLALGLAILLFAVCRLAGKKRYLKHAMRGGIFVYFCAVFFALALALSAPFRTAVFAWQPGIVFADGDVLPRLLGGFYPLLAAGGVCILSGVVYAALYSLAGRLTIEKETMFG